MAHRNYGAYGPGTEAAHETLCPKNLRHGQHGDLLSHSTQNTQAVQCTLRLAASPYTEQEPASQDRADQQTRLLGLAEGVSSQPGVAAAVASGERTMGEVLIDAQDLLATSKDPCEVEAAAQAFRASFYPTPAIRDALKVSVMRLGSRPRHCSLPASRS